MLRRTKPHLQSLMNVDIGNSGKEELELRGKKVGTQMFEDIKQSLETEKDHVSYEKLEVKISLRDMTLEERVQEASKPLYLKRYE